MAARYCTAENIHAVVQFVQERPTESLLLFLLVYSAGIVLMLPGMLLGIGAGAAYGMWVGTVLSWFSTIIGQTGAFLLGRYLLREPVSSFLAQKVPSFTEIDSSLSQEGWKLVLLLRLSPFIPYNVLNYVLGVTSVDLRTYSWVSAFAALPYVWAFAYLGSASNDLYDLLQGDSDAAADLEWTLAGMGIVMVAAALMGWLCKRALIGGSPGGYVRTKSSEIAMESLPQTMRGRVKPGVAVAVDASGSPVSPIAVAAGRSAGGPGAGRGVLVTTAVEHVGDAVIHAGGCVSNPRISRSQGGGLS
jgi:uncharacterized membrane protein YdjX (TVP38/TMEM64 family)